MSQAIMCPTCQRGEPCEVNNILKYELRIRDLEELTARQAEALQCLGVEPDREWFTMKCGECGGYGENASCLCSHCKAGDHCTFCHKLKGRIPVPRKGGGG